jgi:hypothetical protein
MESPDTTSRVRTQRQRAPSVGVSLRMRISASKMRASMYLASVRAADMRAVRLLPSAGIIQLSDARRRASILTSRVQARRACLAKAIDSRAQVLACFRFDQRRMLGQSLQCLHADLNLLGRDDGVHIRWFQWICVMWRAWYACRSRLLHGIGVCAAALSLCHSEAGLWTRLQVPNSSVNTVAETRNREACGSCNSLMLMLSSHGPVSGE